MSRSLSPKLVLALLGLAAFGASPVLAQDEFQSEAQATGTPSSRVAPMTPRADTTPTVAVPRTLLTRPTTLLRPTVEIDPVESFVTTDPVIGPAQERTRRIPRITRYNPRLVPGVRELRAATIRPVEEVVDPSYRLLRVRPVVSGAEQAGPYHRDRYLFYERDRRFNPTPFPGGGYGYNMVR